MIDSHFSENKKGLVLDDLYDGLYLIVIECNKVFVPKMYRVLPYVLILFQEWTNIF